MMKSVGVCVVLMLFLVVPAQADISKKVLDSISTPDTVQTSIGTLKFRGGAPTKKTAQKVYDYLDTMRGVDAFLKGMPAASVQALIKGNHQIGAKQAHQVMIMDKLMDSENEHLFDERSGEVLISPEILSHMLTSVTLRPDLRIIFEELFTSDGAEIFFRPPEYYVELGQELRFCDLQKAIAARGDIALGIFRAATPDLESVDRLSLNPVRDSLWTLAPGDELVVLTTYV